MGHCDQHRSALLVVAGVHLYHVSQCDAYSCSDDELGVLIVWIYGTVLFGVLPGQR